MKFSYVGHASALIEHQGKRLLFDPWLAGPVYWGAWWHFPHAQFDESIFNVDYIYITHWHFDHMHAESLQRFNRNAHLILPKFPVSGLPGPLRDLGFSKMTELDNAETFELSPGFRLSSYQVQLQDDSTAIVECDVPGRDPVVIVNLNDSKPLPSTWNRITRKFPKVEMMLRSHSPAWSYPTAYSFEDPADSFPVSKESYKQAFWTAAEKLKPRYAVAFASGVCHLTDDTLFENQNLVLA
ncbi:MAG: MBL fold metallo-hydrolase, partial [Bdellovibrionota bacterium]